MNGTDGMDGRGGRGFGSDRESGTSQERESSSSSRESVGSSPACVLLLPHEESDSSSSSHLDESPDLRSELNHLSDFNSPPVHVVRYDDPVDSEPDLLIDTEALHQRYRFFEDFREPAKQPKRFVMTPPRDFAKSQSPDTTPAVTRDPNVVRCSDKLDDLPKTETAKKMLNVFKRLESQTDAPNERPGPKLPDDVRDVEPEMARSLKEKFENWTTDSERDNNNKPASNCDSPNEETPQLDTTRKMLVMFKQLESQTSNKNGLANGRPEPKPLKRITPPRDLDVVRDAVPQPPVAANGNHDQEQPVQQEPEIVRSSIKCDDVIPVEPEMARSLRAKFESWATDVERENNNKNHSGAYDLPNDYTPVDTTKNLKAKFESFRCDSSSKPVIEKRKPRVNRFVQEESQENCTICKKILYALEKVEFGGAGKTDKIHKSCFKCTHCSSSLRLDNYTLAAGKFYCLTHFKQLFMAKGNYDEGFGREQHKEKWNSRASSRNQTSEDSEGVDSDITVPAVDVAAPVLSVS